MFRQLFVQHQRVGGDHDPGETDERQLAGAEATHRREHEALRRVRCTRTRSRLARFEPNGSGASATAANSSHDETLADAAGPDLCCVIPAR